MVLAVKVVPLRRDCPIHNLHTHHGQGSWTVLRVVDKEALLHREEVVIRVPMNVVEAGFRTVHVATWDCTQIEGPSADHPAHTEVVGSVPGAAAVHSHDTHRGELHPLDRRLCGA